MGGQRCQVGAELHELRGGEEEDARVTLIARDRLLVAALPLLVLILQLIQLPVNATRGEKLLVRAALAQMALVHDQDAIGALDSRKPMRDDDRRAAFDEMIERLANAALR